MDDMHEIHQKDTKAETHEKDGVHEMDAKHKKDEAHDSRKKDDIDKVKKVKRVRLTIFEAQHVVRRQTTNRQTQLSVDPCQIVDGKNRQHNIPSRNESKQISWRDEGRRGEEMVRLISPSLVLVPPRSKATLSGAIPA